MRHLHSAVIEWNKGVTGIRIASELMRSHASITMHTIAKILQTILVEMAGHLHQGMI